MKLMCLLMLTCAVLTSCGPGNTAPSPNAGGNASAESAGPSLSADEVIAKGVVEELMQASMAQDQEKSKALLIKAEREKQMPSGASYGFNKDGDMESYSIGDVKTEGDEIIVNVSVVMKPPAKSDTMPIVLLKEEATWRVSMDKTFSRYVDILRERRKANSGD
ncbi:MAG: DUF4878 domain-containing protein [Planctomycetes bacterium]|nr:DUF4878 domain-containing protein [Planctomycetota bacterium]